MGLATLVVNLSADIKNEFPEIFAIVGRLNESYKFAGYRFDTLSRSVITGPTIHESLKYLDKVKSTFETRPQYYDSFLDIMKDFKEQKIDTWGVISRVTELFETSGALQEDRKTLIDGFHEFLPPGYKID